MMEITVGQGLVVLGALFFLTHTLALAANIINNALENRARRKAQADLHRAGQQAQRAAHVGGKR